jgi:hypothetical protein
VRYGAAGVVTTHAILVYSVGTISRTRAQNAPIRTIIKMAENGVWGTTNANTLTYVLTTGAVYAEMGEDVNLLMILYMAKMRALTIVNVHLTPVLEMVGALLVQRSWGSAQENVTSLPVLETGETLATRMPIVHRALALAMVAACFLPSPTTSCGLPVLVQP